MISYAQNFEDVMLWRALKQVNNGFYIDVGAWSPNLDSVTRLFYENGWSGINIEPNPEYHKQYISDRDRDVNLNLAVSDIQGEATIYFVDNPGLSSLDKSIAESHESIGYGVLPTQVCVTTLTKVFEEYASGKDVHFLKIDVEGFEKKVLLGNDWKVFRPWIVVVEATLPMSQVENHDEWEYILLEADYVFAYADGLNRFYIAQEHTELLAAFQYPPNVFDGFVLVSQVQAEAKASEAEAKASEAEAKASEAEAKASEAEAKASEAEAKASELIQSSHYWWLESQRLTQEASHYQSLYSVVVGSHSWRFTYPLRQFGKLIRWIVYGSYHWLTFSKTSRPRRVLKASLINLKNKINSRPLLKQKVMRLLSFLPSLQNRLRQVGRFVAVDAKNNTEKLRQENSYNIAQLSPRAKQIYFQLKDAIEQRKISK